MYRAFNVKLGHTAYWEMFSDKYNYDIINFCYKDNLKQLVNASSKLSADEIKELLLPLEQHDIFISHSHRDLELAKGLAGYLETEFGLSCFIDSLYWGNIDDLQEELNKNHLHTDFSNGKKYFNHQGTMEVAKHANMILASALTQMIDKCECVFFLNTDNSIIKGVDVINQPKTNSPWIYHEVFTTTIIHRRNSKCEDMHENYQIRDSVGSQLPQFIYNLDLTGMTYLNDDSIDEWCAEYVKVKNMYTNRKLLALKKLYELNPEKK